MLSFFLSLVFFVQRGMPLLDVFFRSLIVFIAVTILAGVVALVFMKSLHQSEFQQANKPNKQKYRNES